MCRVGVIANPEAGKDVRRIVAHASFVSNFTKIDSMKRFIVGLDAAGVDEVFLMPDIYGLSESVIEGLRGKVSVELHVLDMECVGTVNDTINAASMMRKLGAKIIAGIGGDGTLRAIYKGAGASPIVGIPLGTNNVLGATYDSTVVGLVAGMVATGRIPLNEVAIPMKTVKAYVNGVLRDEGLIDLALIEKGFVGARAIWDVSGLRYVFYTKGEPSDVGLASLAGFISPVSFKDDYGLFVEIGEGGFEVSAILAPGLVKSVSVKSYRVVKLGEEVTVPRESYVLAFDGERELTISRNNELSVKIVRDGPLLLDVRKAFDKVIASLNLINKSMG